MKKGTPIYYHEKTKSKSVWKDGFVHQAQEHMVLIKKRSDGVGVSLKVAYEDVRLKPENSLLQELDDLELQIGTDLDIDSDDEEQPNDKVDGDFTSTDHDLGNS